MKKGGAPDDGSIRNGVEGYAIFLRFFRGDVENGVFLDEPVDAVGEEVGAYCLGGIILQEFGRAHCNDARGEHRGLGGRVGCRAAVERGRDGDGAGNVGDLVEGELLRISRRSSALADPAPRIDIGLEEELGLGRRLVRIDRRQRDRTGIVKPRAGDWPGRTSW